MKQLTNKRIAAVGMIAGLLMGMSPAHAVYTIAMTEIGGNVVATGSGAVTTAGLTLNTQPTQCLGANGNGSVIPSTGHICLGTGSTGLSFNTATSPSTLGTGLTHFASGGSGQPVILDSGVVFLPVGYLTGAQLSNSSTWAGETLTSLGVTPGTYTWTFGSGPNTDSIVLQIGSATSPVTSPPILSNVNLPGAVGIASQLVVLDLSSGGGPSMTLCLANALQQVFGASASYLGQSSNGAARIAVGTQTLSFYPIAASTSTTQGIGVFLNGDNTINVGTSCGTFTVVPAIANMADLGAALTAMGLNAQIDTKGIFTATVAGGLYAVRADYFVTKGTATGTPSLAFGGDGLLRLTDRDGNVQILRAAFLDTSALQSAMGAALGGVVTTQADGSGVFTRINGVSWALTPEMVLTPASQVQGSGSLINDRANHYLFRIANFYQGFTATVR